MTDAPTGTARDVEVSVATLLTLLGAAPTASREAVLRTARDGRHKLAATLLSLWAEDGATLTPAETAELRLHRERVDHYRGVWSRLRTAAPGASLLKGMTIASLYPPGVLRAAGDLDVVCPDHADLWSCAHELAATGWELAAFTVSPARTGDSVPLHLGAEFRSPAPEPSPDPYAVGLFTAEIVTEVRAPAWQLSRPSRSPLALCAVALVAERWERPFRSRDLLDLALLLQHLDDTGVRQLRTDLARTGLWPEWREALRAMARLGWRPSVTLPHTRTAAVRARLLRAARTATRWSSPVRAPALIAQAGIEGEGGRLSELASDLAHRGIGARRLLGAGLPLFGVPLDGKPAERLSLDDVGRHLVARTPLGSFLLVSGAARREWLDEAAGGGPAAGGHGTDPVALRPGSGPASEEHGADRATTEPGSTSAGSGT
ncbi:nucleotidyltransferase family protein [Streptomyces sp. NPDC051920]|uniref:nucleotidyltransferase family protein n=1 Tax=Streptomyces sp. NPDC051920 TaxID=3155523 RepID=UPI0034464504